MPESSRFGHLPWLLLSVLILVADRVTKDIFEGGLSMYQRIEVIPGYFDWTLAYNTGAAFSFLSDAGGWQKYFFTALAIAISGLMAWWLRGTARGNWKAAVPYALIIGGAIGNVIDRQVHGHVVDFIQWYVGSYTWPSFNIADSAIVVGAIGIALFGLFDGKSAKKADNANPKP